MKPNFFDQVYGVVKNIPAGNVMTYGQVAKALGTKDARRIGHALHANKSSEVPCHRVVNAQGKLAENFAFNGAIEQRRRLETEGVLFVDKMHVNLEKCRIK